MFLINYRLACVVLAALLMVAGVARVDAAEPKLAQYLNKVQPADLFAGADRFGPIQVKPSVVPVYKGDSLLGHAFLNSDFVNTTGYSGRPIHVMVGMAPDGTVTGAKLVDHHEPIVLIGIPPERINAFIDGYVGKSVLELTSQSAGRPPVDIVSGATVTVMVIGDSIIRSGKKVMQALGAPAAAEAPTVTRSLDLSKTGIADWETLVGDGSVRRLHLTVAQVNEAFELTGRQDAKDRPEPGAPDDAFIDFYAALATIPTVGRSLLGDAEYESLVSRLKPGQHAIVLAGTGRYSFKGSGYVRGGIFDRFELIQGDVSTRFRDRTHKRLGTFAAAGAPTFDEIGLFILPEGAEFDPAEPWRIQLLVHRAVAALEKTFVTFDLGYQPPEKYLKVDAQAVSPAAQPAPAAAVEPAELEPAETPLWQRIWENRLLDIAIVVAAITLLTGIFFFQDQLVKRPKLYGRVRTGFLLFTLSWLGWYTTAQLSVVNILTFANSLRTDFSWDYFLMDPLVFILWFSVAASLLFWGRGAFCGWLCPFGALQELASKVAKALGVRQITVPFGLHQRLWPIKYMIFLVLFGLSLYSLALAEQASEVEPFKTAIILHFLREWWFVLFAVALIVAGLFIERFFCRYLCPLGAALAIPGRLRMFDWLKRYKECGNPCRRCANECPVQAIHPEGHINPNECIQCLHCQVLYHHDRKCPVMIQKRLKRERRDAHPSAGPIAEAKPRAVAQAIDPATGT